MKHIPEEEIMDEIYFTLRDSITTDYADELIHCRRFVEYVRKDIEETSGWKDDGYYNDSDVRLAVGRALIDLLKEETK